MSTKLDMRTNLLQRVNNLSAKDLQQLKIFLSGMESGKAIQMNVVLPNSENMESKEQKI